MKISKLVTDFDTGDGFTLAAGASVSDGELVITTDTVNVIGKNQVSSVDTFDLTSSYLVFKLAHLPSGENIEATFGVSSASMWDGTESVFFYFWTSGSVQHFETWVGSTNIESLAVPVTHMWWRIREATGLIYFDTSPDGLEWTNQSFAATPATTLAATRVRIGFNCHGGGEIGTLALDSINVIPRDNGPFRPAVPDQLPGSTILGDEQNVVVRTNKGVQLYQFTASQQFDMSWSRELREVSRCDLTVPSTLDYDRIPNLVPWLHWVDVWDNRSDAPLWSGPIQKVTSNRQQMTISSRDPSALFARTRCPMTKRWDGADPADIAEELMAAMVELHGLNTRAIVTHDPLGDRFDFSVKADETMLDSVFDDLTRLGLFWTFVAGRPILGPRSRKPVTALGENHFIGSGMSIVRDGSVTFNDVLVRGPDNLARASVEMGGLRLQQTVDIDSMFALSNVDRQAKVYSRYVSRIRDTVELPRGSVLAPNAPITVDQLVPSTRIVIDAFGLLLLMQLTSVNVNFSQGTAAVSIELEAVDDELPELIEIQQDQSISGINR